MFKYDGSMTISGTTIANNSAEVRRALGPPPPTRVALRGSDTSVAGVRGREAAACRIQVALR